MKRLLKAISILPETMLLINGNGIILGSNAAAHELFGRSIEEGVSLSSLVSDSSEKVLRCLHLWFE